MKTWNKLDILFSFDTSPPPFASQSIGEDKTWGKNLKITGIQVVKENLGTNTLGDFH